MNIYIHIYVEFFKNIIIQKQFYTKPNYITLFSIEYVLEKKDRISYFEYTSKKKNKVVRNIQIKLVQKYLQIMLRN